MKYVNIRDVRQMLDCILHYILMDLVIIGAIYSNHLYLARGGL